MNTEIERLWELSLLYHHNDGIATVIAMRGRDRLFETKKKGQKYPLTSNMRANEEIVGESCIYIYIYIRRSKIIKYM